MCKEKVNRLDWCLTKFCDKLCVFTLFKQSPIICIFARESETTKFNRIQQSSDMFLSMFSFQFLTLCFSFMILTVSVASRRVVSYGLGNAPRTRRALADSSAPRSVPRCQCVRENDNTCLNFCRPENRLRCASHSQSIFTDSDTKRRSQSVVLHCLHHMWRQVLCRKWITEMWSCSHRVFLLPLSGMRQRPTWWFAPPGATTVLGRSANTSWQQTRTGLRGKTTRLH